MWVFAQKVDGRVVYISGVVTGSQGQLLAQPYDACLAAALMVNPGLAAEDLTALQVQDLAEAKRIDQMPEAARLGVMSQGELTGVELDPAYAPPEPAQDPLAALKGDVARLEETVRKTIPVSPHDKRFLAQKEIGKTIIAWIKANPTCTPQEVEDHVMAQVLAELPGQPVVPKLYWEWTDPATGQTSPQGLAMSYCYEAVVRGYLPPEAPVSWPTLVQLIVATPEEQIAAWLRTL